MKIYEIRQLPVEELRTHLEEAKEELFNLRFQQATGQLENYKRLGLLRKAVAQTLTVIRERELGIEAGPAGEPAGRGRRAAEEAPVESRGETRVETEEDLPEPVAEVGPAPEREAGEQ